MPLCGERAPESRPPKTFKIGASVIGTAVGTAPPSTTVSNFASNNHIYRYTPPPQMCLNSSELLASCVVLGSWSNKAFWLLFCKFSGGLIK